MLRRVLKSLKCGTGVHRHGLLGRQSFPSLVRVALALCAALSAACEDAASDADTCPIPPPGRVLVQEAVVESFLSILAATEHAFEHERAIVFLLLGRPWGYGAFLFLAPPGRCLGPEAFYGEAWCDSRFPEPSPLDEFSKTYDSCFRLGCESTRVGLVDVYFTVKPRTAPEDRHPFEYEATNPVGRMRYDPNPYLTTRVDLRDPALTIVSAELRHKVTFTPPGGSPLDISHAGTIIATKRGTRIQSVFLLVFFTGFTPPGSPVILSVQQGDVFSDVDGAVRVGNRVLATIQGHFDPRANLFSWQGACASTSTGAQASGPVAPSLLPPQ